MDAVEGMSFGSFRVDALGRMSLAGGQAGGFAFRWRGRPIRVSLQAPASGSDDAGTPSCLLSLTARAGRVPSSANAQGRRPEAFAMLKTLQAALPDGWRLQLLADHALQVRSEAPVPLPAGIAELMVPAARFTLELAPYLDLLDETGMGMEA